LIKIHGKGDEKERARVAKAFKTSFDRAVETVKEGGRYNLSIQDIDSTGIIYSEHHDGEIDVLTGWLMVFGTMRIRRALHNALQEKGLELNKV